MTPLYREENGVLVFEASVKQEVYATDSEHSLTKNKAYIIEAIVWGEIVVVNDKGEKELYSPDWFSLSQLL